MADERTQDVADRVLSKLRAFVDTLDPEERSVLAALLAPGVASAFGADAEVSGFGAPSAEWAADRLPEALAERVRSGRIHIEMS